MKLPLLFALLATATPLAARAQSATPPEVPMDALPMAPKSAATADALVWRVQPEVGSHWQMRMFVRTESKQTLPTTGNAPAMNVNATVLERFVADYDVLSRDSFGASTIRVTFRDMKIDTSTMLNGKPVAAPAMEKPPSSAINGASYTIKQAPDGKIWGVVGMKEFQNKMFDALGITDAAARASQAQLNESLDPKKLMASISGQFPTSPVRVGEGWDFSIDLPIGAPLKLMASGHNTLNSLTPDVALISTSAQLQFGATNAAPISDGNGGKVSVDARQISGNFSGYSRVDRASGLALESMVTELMNGSMRIEATDKNGKTQPPQSVPLNIKIEIRTVLEPR